METVVLSRYITCNPQILSGEPIIKGTRTPIRSIVNLWRLGYAPEEIPIHLPHLTVAQVLDALSYHSDNQAEINNYIGKKSRSERKTASFGSGYGNPKLNVKESPAKAQSSKAKA